MRGIDTAYNYRDFTSHCTLARTAGDLLGAFTLTTKVGFFRNGDGSVVHSLDRARLRHAVEQSANELGRTPNVVFLHSPERTLAGLPVQEGRDRLQAACAVLAEAVTAGWCGSWGIATWDPRRIVEVLSQGAPAIQACALLLRSGLAASEPVLTAGEQLCRLLGVPSQGRWGMSPFGGNTTDEAWHTANLRAFLTPGQQCSNLQAAFRVAFELPQVARVTVGTSSLEHLRDLTAATELVVNDAAIGRYRELLSEAS